MELIELFTMIIVLYPITFISWVIYSLYFDRVSIDEPQMKKYHMDSIKEIVKEYHEESKQK